MTGWVRERWASSGVARSRLPCPPLREKIHTRVGLRRRAPVGLRRRAPLGTADFLDLGAEREPRFMRVGLRRRQTTRQRKSGGG